MAILTDDKKQIIDKHQRQDNDTGSVEVQVAILTAKIADLTEHLKVHKKDYSSRRGLLKMVARRTNLLKYLQRIDRPRYLALIQSLGLRK
ncbi:MAG: 30S ribosomal protein S15 [Planctomycetota bacterium]